MTNATCEEEFSFLAGKKPEKLDVLKEIIYISEAGFSIHQRNDEGIKRGLLLLESGLLSQTGENCFVARLNFFFKSGVEGKIKIWFGRNLQVLIASFKCHQYHGIVPLFRSRL